METKADFDLLLINGIVADGSGAEPSRADVGICGNRIKTVGQLGKATATRILDCAGLCVAPGFIDVHSHSECFCSD